jgi:hypothetical protein
LEPADLFYGFNALRVVVAVEKPILDALDDHAAYVGCGVGLSKVSLEENQEPISPLCSRLAAVQVWNSLDFDALRAKVTRRYIVARERR